MDRGQNGQWALTHHWRAPSSETYSLNVESEGDSDSESHSRDFLFFSTVADRKLRRPAMEDSSERYRFEPVLRWNSQVEEYFAGAYGAQHFARISKALTRPSCYSCVRVNKVKFSTDAVAKKLSAILVESEDENGAEEGQSRCVRNGNSNTSENAADLFKRSFEGGLVSKCQFPGLDYVLFVKGSGPHTIDYGYAEGKPPKEVIVSRKCAEAVLRGAQVYVPGVLACSGHVDKGEIVAVSVALEQRAPDGGWSTGITRGIVLQGSQTDPQYCERKGLYIGQGKAMLSRPGIFRVLQGIAVDMCNRVFKLPSFHNVLEGEIFLQNLPSIVAAHALDPKRGERVLDMCAAPGGKTTAICILMNDEGEVIACDRSHNKVKDIEKLAAEMGLKSITTFKLDALKSVRQGNVCDDAINLACNDDNDNATTENPDLTKLQKEENASISSEHGDKESSVSSEKENEKTYVSKADIRKNLRRQRNERGRNQCTGGRVKNSKGFPPHSFDRVLLDAPCSALGLRPRLFSGEETLHSLRCHATYQRRMVDQAVQLVRPGGVLVYSTCTLNPGENEALVRYALDTYQFLSLAPQHPRIGGPGLVGNFRFPDGRVEEWLRPGEEELVQRFDPSSPLDTIGFFIAKFSVASEEI